ncbi:MAG: hypothetical protein IJE04_00375 [Bacilli bacterium]|nr:hypothetical protein [Bacilli bacterium]
MLEKLQYKNIKKYKRYIPFDINTNSKLYFDKDLIHKIPFIKERGLDNLLKYLGELNLKELVEIRKLIYNHNLIVGYSMKNYKGYKSLAKFKKRKLNLKKEDCFKIIKSVQVLSQNKISFFDSHLGNVLLNRKTNDIKICDIDGLVLKESTTLDYGELKDLLIFLLSYLYNIRECDIRNYLKCSDKGLNNLFIDSCKLGEDNLSVEKIKEIVNTIKYKTIIQEREYIIDKSIELTEMGYAKYNRF